MAAGHLMRGRPGAEQILLANGAIGHVLARLAVVIVEEEGVDAHATVMTVLEVLSATDSAKTTVGAMVRLLLGRHPQVADITVVLSESDATFDALVAVPRGYKSKEWNRVGEFWSFVTRVAEKIRIGCALHIGLPNAKEKIQQKALHPTAGQSISKPPNRHVTKIHALQKTHVLLLWRQ